MDKGLTKTVIQSRLKTEIFARELFVLDTIDSTNRHAKDLAKAGKPEGTLVYAEEQTRGQGRRGRFWDSPRGKGLWFSLILRPQSDSPIPLLNRLSALSLVQVIEKQFRLTPQIKEPNDVFLQDRKLAGILVETSRGRHSISYAIVGIGLNVNQEREDFALGLRDQAISLRIALNRVVDRLNLLIELLAQLEDNYCQFKNQNSDSIYFRPGLSRNHLIKDVKGISHVAGC